MTGQLNVALIGSKFMGRAHSNAWSNVAQFFDVDPQPVMHTVAGRNADELAAFHRPRMRRLAERADIIACVYVYWDNFRKRQS